LFRKVRKILTGKSGLVKAEPSFKQIMKSFLALLTLLFRKDMILAFNPYDNIIYYLIFLKLLNKNIIFNTSWAYWNTNKYVKKPFFISKFLWRIFLKNTKVFGCNKAALRSLKKYKVKPHYLPHSIDADIFTPKTNKNKTPRIIYVGRLMEQKGIKGILEVSKKFKDCEFLFVGDGPLAGEIQKYDNARAIPFVKGKKQVAYLYNSSDIFVLNSYATPKWEEWFGLVLIESMACELACVSTDCVGPKEILEDNKTGFLIEQKNNKQLEEKIRILIKDKKLRRKLGKAARKSVLENFSIKKIAPRALKLLFSS
jgi:glycosyltransferase involved in cell wall biosynthesis